MDDADAIAQEDQARHHRSRAAAGRREGARGPAEADNLVGIYAALADTTKAEVLQQFGGQGWGAFKPALADLAVDKLSRSPPKPAAWSPTRPRSMPSWPTAPRALP